MSEREYLPNRREAVTMDIDHCYPGGKPMVVTATFSRFRDGRIAEVFLDAVRLADKPTLTDKLVSIDMHDASVILSFALQHGASLSEIKKALLHGEDGVPHGCIGAVISAFDAAPI